MINPMPLIEQMARMTTPTDGVTDPEKCEDIMADLDEETMWNDCAAFYDCIRQARAIIKSGEKPK